MTALGRLAVACLLLGGLVWTAGIAGLARQNPHARIPRRSNQGRWRYRGVYAVGLIITIFAITTLQNDVGLWSVVPAFAIAVTPQLVLITAHQRRLRRSNAAT